MSAVNELLAGPIETQPETNSLQQQIQSLLKENHTVQQKYEKLEEQYGSAQKEIQQLKEAQLASNATAKMQHSAEFWIDIKDKVIRDPDYIKGLVKNKQMTLRDTNTYGRTLLGISALKGSYSMVQFCLNGGSDITHKDHDRKTALYYAISNGYYHIQQLLLFSQLNVSSGNKIRDIANTINKQKGINQNVARQLTDIGQETKAIFEAALLTVMINLINQKLSFDDAMLNMAWDIACNDTEPLSSDLWKSIALTCVDILHNSDARDWYWFKSFLLPSTIWFKTISTENNRSDKEEKHNTPQYLYFELLKLVNGEAKVQLNALETDLNELASKHPVDWKKITTWDEPNDHTVARQDHIPNGIQSDYTYSQLLEKSDAQFNAHTFYDYNHYLSELILLAQIVDDDFHHSVQNIFNINRYTHIGTLHDEKRDDDNEDEHTIKYRRGPVKLMERARAKAAQDYFLEPYPTTACVLDLNRCTFIFNDIHTLLRALKLFVNKIRYFQSGCVIGMVRNKNGFKDYIQETQYADIKLNVLIKGKKNNIIGEVQFLLEVMREFKDRAHNLYIVQRQREYFQNSVSNLLPTLLDEEKQLFIAGSMNDVKGLCRLIKVQNFTTKDIIKTNKENQTILLHACELGNEKVFLFLKSILRKDLFVQCLFAAAIYDDKPIEMAVAHNHPCIIRHVFQMKEVQERYNTRDSELFRLLYHLFGFNTDAGVIDYILSQLNISNDKVSYMMYYAYSKKEMKKRIPANGYHYDRRRLVSNTVANNKLSILKKLVSIIGEKTFINASFISDYTNLNAMEYAITHQKMKIIQYMLSFDEIKEKYSNDDELYRLMYWLLGRCLNEDIIDYIRTELNISDEKISSLLTYAYPVPSKPIPPGVIRYHQYTILGTMIRRKPVSSVKKLVSIIGEKHFCECVFTANGININTIEYAVAVNKIEVMQYILSFRAIKEILELSSLLFRLVYWLFARCRDEEMVNYVLSELNLNTANETLQTLVGTYLYPPPPQPLPSNAIKYDMSIIAAIICQNTLTSLKKLKSIIGEKTFMNGVILSNQQNINALEFALRHSDPSMHTIEMFEYIVSMKCIQEIYANNTDLLYRLIYWLFAKCRNKRMIHFVSSQLSLSKESFKTLLSHQYPPPSDDHSSAPDAIEYHAWTILSAITCNNNTDTCDSLEHIVSIIGDKAFSDRVFAGTGPSQRDINTIEYAIVYGKTAIIEYILSFKDIKDRYLKDDALLFRLLYWLFARNDDEAVIDLVLSQLEIPNERIATVATQYAYPPPSSEAYHSRSAIGAIVSLQQNTGQLLRKFVSLFGEKIFIDAVFVADIQNMNAMEYVIRYNEMETVKYLLSFESMKQRYLQDDDALFRLLYWLLVRCKDDKMVSYVFSTLNVAHDKIAELVSHSSGYQYKAPSQSESQSFASGAIEYHTMTLVSAAICNNNTLHSFKEMENIVGHKTFIDALFCDGSDRKNAMQWAVEKNKVDIMQYFMSIHDVREKCMNGSCDIVAIATESANASTAMMECIKNALDAHTSQPKIEVDLD